jgi:predicted transcriptional regulator
MQIMSREQAQDMLKSIELAYPGVMREMLMSPIQRRVYGCVAIIGEATSRDVADEMQITIQQASVAMSLLCEKHWLKRTKNYSLSGGNVYIYEVDVAVPSVLPCFQDDVKN